MGGEISFNMHLSKTNNTWLFEVDKLLISQGGGPLRKVAEFFKFTRSLSGPQCINAIVIQ